MKIRLPASGMVFAGFAAWLLVVAGCGDAGPQRALVFGAVKVDGSPFNGRIDFTPLEGQGPTSGAEIKDGIYRIEKASGVTVGKNRVSIRGPRPTGRRVANPMRPGLFMDETEEAVPPEYNERTTLIRTVEPGRNEFDFDLPGRKPSPAGGK